jgi:integrase
MRPGEMKQLRRKDIHFNEGYIDVVASISKTERQRIVPISERMGVVLRKLIAGKQHNDFLFNKTSPVKSFRTICRLAKIEGLTLYCLRHTYASRLVKLGTELSMVARALGHTSVAMSYRYTNQDLESVKMIANAINEYAKRSSQK